MTRDRFHIPPRRLTRKRLFRITTRYGVARHREGGMLFSDRFTAAQYAACEYWSLGWLRLLTKYHLAFDMEKGVRP